MQEGGTGAPKRQRHPQIQHEVADLIGRAEPGSTVTVRVDGREIGYALADSTGSWRFTPAAALTSGARNITLVATDAAGNVSTPAAYVLQVDASATVPTVALSPVADSGAATTAEDETAWSRSILPLLESAAARLLMSGTLERADGRPILWLPYRAPTGVRRVREIDFKAPGWAIVGYSRRQALAEKAILRATDIPFGVSILLIAERP